MSQRPAPDLSVNKVLAGAGAAVTAAVIGSFFGVAGTVVGAAIGSVASTIATSLYELSLNTTRDRIKARLIAGGNSDVEEDRPEPPPPRPWGRWVGATALVFLLGMLVVTGVEFVKGSSIAGTPGTSVGGVFEPSTAGADTAGGRPDDDVVHAGGALDEGARHAVGNTAAVGHRRAHPLGHPDDLGSRARPVPWRAARRANRARDAPERGFAKIEARWCASRQELLVSVRRDRRRVAAAAGSSASVIARTTTTRCAPAASTSSRRSWSMPPMANHGRAGARSATVRTRSRPGAGRPGFVGVGQHGPTQK